MEDKMERVDALEKAIEVLKAQPGLFKGFSTELEADKKEGGRVIARQTCLIAEYFIRYTEGKINPWEPEGSGKAT